MNQFKEDNSIIMLFGNLKNRPVADVAHAEKVLESMIQGGKADFRKSLNERLTKVQEMQAQRD